ncbi:coiled-coil domain-containing protein 178 [Osmerus mordax]|uniref:coiled-coil domain-containing protein 178 n=1 Tax=Osmerus mordax TaxID=8014 RepID=UPI00350FF56D
MPEVEPLRFPSREGGLNLQDQEDLQAVCPGRRRSCALVNTPSPCVNKAVCHIQELKRKLEDWCQQSVNDQHQMSHEKHQNSKTLRFHSTDSDTDSLISTELYIEGIGLSARERAPSPSLRKETTDVLVEVVYLIERLEADRQNAEEALLVEKKRRRTLGKKMDSICLWRQQEFPGAVQKEHEACTRDICELQWHLRFGRDRLTHVKDKLSHTAVVNQRLLDDIDFIKKHGPLVKEKLEFERNIMNQINTAQQQADESYTHQFKELRSAEEQLRREQEAAQKQREEMACVLKDIQSQLHQRLKDLEQLQAHGEGQRSKVEEMEEKVAFTVKLSVALSLHIPLLQKKETDSTDLVLELKIIIGEEVGKIDEIKEQIAELLKDIQGTRLAGEAEVSLLEEVFRKKRQDLLALLDHNAELDMEIQDYTKKIEESKQAVKRLHKDRKRFLEKISLNEERRDEAKEELNLTASVHDDTKTRLEAQEQLTFREEQRNRKAIEELKKQLMGEMNALAVLKSQLSAVKAQLQQEQSTTEVAKQELKKEFEEALSATGCLEVEMEELRKIHEEKSQTICNLMGKLNEIRSEHQRTSDKMEAERNLKLDHLSNVKKQHRALTEKYDRTLSRMNELSEKSKEYRAANDQMDQTAATMPAVIDELQSVLEAVEFKMQTATLVMSTLQADTEACQRRTHASEQAHNALLTIRQQKMRDTKDALKTELKENAVLGAEYRELQNVLMVEKQEAVCVFDKKNRAQGSFHDHKQLSLLQNRMHIAVVKSFRQRSLHSQAELAHFQVLSNENNHKIKSVQEELSNAIRRISAFLRSLTDDSTPSDDGAEDKQAGADAVGLNKKMPTVQIAV